MWLYTCVPAPGEQRGAIVITATMPATSTTTSNPPAVIPPTLSPTPAPTLGPHPALTCPQVDEPLVWAPEGRSLYLLYAHLQEALDFQLDDPVECGQVIGKIGQSGNALNPHLHLEVRLGPAGAHFDSLAHYSGGITLVEMRNYCVWRVSGVFQLVDPMSVLGLLPLGIFPAAARLPLLALTSY